MLLALHNVYVIPDRKMDGWRSRSAQLNPPSFRPGPGAQNRIDKHGWCRATRVAGIPTNTCSIGYPTVPAVSTTRLRGRRQNEPMAWVPIHAGQDHLQQFGRRSSIDALTELIWNGLDAEADTVKVETDVQTMIDGSREMSYVTRVTVTDNGHGMTPDKAREAFASLGDSWKRNLNGRTVNGKRAIHGSQGRGRFFAYSLGHRANWTSIAETDGEFTQVEISGDQSRIDGFTIGEGKPVAGPTGTVVVIEVEQGRPLAALTSDDVTQQIAGRLAAHLLGNRDITVQINGLNVDPEPLIDGEPTELQLDEVPAGDLGEREVPVLLLVDWTDEMRSAPGVVLCTKDGASLVEVDKSGALGTVRSTGYLRWSGWSEVGADLLLARFHHPTVIDAAIDALAAHVAARTGAMTATIVATLKEEGAYPYPDEIDDPVRDTERQLFDLVAVTARGPLRQSNRRQRKMTARLLQLALQERPESLDVILGEALALSPDERDELAELLQFSSLGSIVGAAAEVTRRLDLLATLRHVIYSQEVAAEMREVDQLHPLIRDNVWLFGEAWRLSASEAGLTNVLRAAVGDDVALETELIREGKIVRLPDGKRGRVDLLLQRTLVGPDDRQDRLVVELKRPSVYLGSAELTQVRRYAHALSEHPGAGPTRWTFWLVGSDTKDEIGGELEPQDREWGHVTRAQKYDVKVTTWGRLLDQSERRLVFYREQLAYNASQEQAVERVRQRHQELLPASAGASTKGDAP